MSTTPLSNFDLSEIIKDDQQLRAFCIDIATRHDYVSTLLYAQELFIYIKHGGEMINELFPKSEPLKIVSDKPKE